MIRWGWEARAREHYANIKGKKADACTQCGKCEEACTQHLHIIEALSYAHATLGDKGSD